MELAQKKKELAAQGLGLAAVTYDSVAILKHFSDRKSIDFPLLSDAGSVTIRAFGILNENIPKDNPFYGIPFPGSYVVDAQGVVRSKFFEDDYRERYTAGAILTRQLHLDGSQKTEVETKHLKLRYWASNNQVVGGSRITLVLEVELAPGMHVYAPGVQSSYIPIDWKIASSKGWLAFPAEYPAAKTLHMPAIQETAPVYEGKIRIVRDLTIAQAGELTAALGPHQDLTVEGSFRYQACDDKVCYTPQTVGLKWTFQEGQHDRERVPAAIRVLQ
ncbi:MAG: redoxin domain-containing protein [Acidobacteriia bacterium]|nr:redoxin domain-containing protein [Terriglobia bacterium]